MNVTGFNINLTSEDPERLIAFYRDRLQLPAVEDMGPGAFAVGGAVIIVSEHSETLGTAKEPSRILVNLHVDDVVAERERLEAAGVSFIRKEGREYWGGIISTWLIPTATICSSSSSRSPIPEGLMVYPGEGAGTRGPVGSMRLAMIRDGIDDYDYVQILEDLGKGTEARAVYQRAAANLRTWSRDPDDYYAVREKLAELIEAET